MSYEVTSTAETSQNQTQTVQTQTLATAVGVETGTGNELSQTSLQSESLTTFEVSNQQQTNQILNVSTTEADNGSTTLQELSNGITEADSLSENSNDSGSLDEHDTNYQVVGPPFVSIGLLASNLNEESVQSSTLSETSNNLLGGFSLVETQQSSNTLEQHTDSSTGQGSGVAQQENDTSSVSETGNVVLGNTTQSETDASSATLTQTDFYSVNNVDSQTESALSSVSLVETSNTLTGEYSLRETDGDVDQANQSTNRSGVFSGQQQSLSDTGSLTQVGNNYSGWYTLNQFSGSTASLTQTQNDGVSSLTLVEVMSSGAQATQFGNTNTGMGDQTATLTSTDTIIENGGSSDGETLSLSQSDTSIATRNQLSNSVSGAYLLQQEGSASSSMVEQGVNQTGSFSVLQATSSTLLQTESGKEPLKNNLNNFLLMLWALRDDGVVPLAMKLVAFDTHASEFFVCDFGAGWILAFIQLRVNGQPR